MSVLHRLAIRQIKPFFYCNNQLQYALANSHPVRYIVQSATPLQQKSSKLPSHIQKKLEENGLVRPNLMSRLKNFLASHKPKGITEQKLITKSEYLYFSVIASIDYKAFFEIFALPNTFNSWFLVTELHIWLLLVRAKGEESSNADDVIIQRSILTAMWNDVRDRVISFKGEDMSLSEQNESLATLTLHFYQSYFLYDQGLLSDDKVLANNLWNVFLESNCDDLWKIELLVKYVRRTAQALDALDMETIFDDTKHQWIVPLKKIDFTKSK